MLSSVKIFSLLASCSPPSCYPVTSTDCVGDVCDITQPLEDAVRSCESNPPVKDNPISGNRLGCHFELPTGRFLLSRTIDLCRQHTIVGQGGRFWGARTRIETLGGYTAFHLKFYTECNAAGRGGGAGGSELRDFAIYSPLGRSRETPSYGVLVHAARVRLDRLWIRGFTQGIRIDADIHSTPKTNANLFVISDVTVDVNEHAGIWIQGGDSNAGLLEVPNAPNNCWFASRWESKLGECANIVDHSFLGNTLIAGHTAHSQDAETREYKQGYRFRGQSQRSVCVGCYAEMDQSDNELSPNSNAVGGLSWWSGLGQWLFGPRVNRLIATNAGDPSTTKDDVHVELGSASNLAGVAFQIRAMALQSGAWPLAFHVNALGGFYSLRLANSEHFSVVRIYGVNKEPYKLGDYWLKPSN